MERGFCQSTWTTSDSPFPLPIFSPSNYSGIGGPAALPTLRLENTFNPNVTLTKVSGAHTIKFGTNIVRRQIIDFQTNQGDGLFNFDPTFTANPNSPGTTGDSMASFLLGTASGISQDFLLVWPGIRTIEIGSFIQDDWKVNARLTLNLGLRWDIPGQPHEVNGVTRTLRFDLDPKGPVLWPEPGKTADFYLGTVRTIFQEYALPLGKLTYKGQPIAPRSIRRTALLTVEGEKDDICAIGQTMAALDLCRGLPVTMKRHHLQTGVGHYGVFSGRRWAQQVYPRVREVIQTNEG